MNTFKNSAIIGLCLALVIGCTPENTNSMADNTKVKDGASQKSAAHEPPNNPELLDLAKRAKSNGYAYEITQSLTTEIGPRLAASAKEKEARDWAVAKFRDYGFENVRIEPFEMKGWARLSEGAYLVKPSAQPLYITALGGSVSTPISNLEAPVAYFENFEALKNAPAGGLEGKIAYISGKMEKAHNGSGYGPANMKRRSGAAEAAKRGAIAVLIRSVGTDSHRMPHTGAMRYEDGIPKIPAAALSNPDADQLDRLFAMGKDVVIGMNIQTTTFEKGMSGNVIGEIVGSEKPDEVVIISAHLDSWDQGTGAIDDGAGVGIVMGAGRTLIEAGKKPKRTIRVILFGAEEVGLLGGFAYVKQHKDELDKIVMATESDFGAERVIGFQMGKYKNAQAAYDTFYKNLAFLGIEKTPGVSNGGPDIFPFFNEGVPTMRLNQDGYDYFDLHHTPDDTFDKIDPEAIAQNQAAYTLFAWMAANTNLNLGGK